MSALLAPLKNYNPQLNNWERARDPLIPVQDLGLRSGRRRKFNLERIRGVYDECQVEIWAEYAPTSREGEARAELPGPEGQEYTRDNSVPSDCHTPPGLPPRTLPGLPRISKKKLRRDRGFHRNVDNTRWPRSSAPGGAFYLRSSGEESQDEGAISTASSIGSRGGREKRHKLQKLQKSQIWTPGR